jgi:hypothetical protein
MLTKTIDREPIAADEDELADLAELDRMIRDSEPDGLRLVSRMGEEVVLTGSTLRVLRQAVDALVEHRVVEISQMPRDLPLEAAAEILGVTQAYFAQLLDQGMISSRNEYGAPRVQFEDLMAYKRVRDAERCRLLDELTRQGQEIGHLLGDRWPGDES